ncbi:hypothetical protein ACFL54_00610 [Planctomycetota bacterium]
MKKIVLSLFMVLIVVCGLTVTMQAKELEDFFKDNTPLISLSQIIDQPVTYKGVQVVFEARFHKIDDLYTTVYTPYIPHDYLNFSVWEPDARLWGDEVSSDFPFLYVRKGTQSGFTLGKIMQRLKKYEKIRLEAKVGAVFDGRPYLEVFSIVRLEEDETNTEKGLLFINLAERETEKDGFTEAAKLYLKAVDSGLCREFEGMCYRRAGELNFKIRNYERALELLKVAKKRLPKDPQIEDLIAIVRHVISNEESGNIPADVVKEDIQGQNDSLQETVKDMQRELDRLRDEITELSNQKISWLKEKSVLANLIEEIKAQLLSQQELQMLRDDMRRLQESVDESETKNGDDNKEDDDK